VKREYVVALCVLVVAIFAVVRTGTTASWLGSSPAQRGGDQALREGLKVDSPRDGENKQLRTRHRLREDVRREVTTKSGLVYTVLEKGKGEHPGPSSTVKVHYVGTFEDGTVFDSSRDRGSPADFPLNAVIKGWTEGVQLMKPGARYRFEIPPDLGYGDTGARELIPPGSTLIFEIELISIEAP
jgi:FKBP-type peptidyl-prolyl cis-trans isomerase FkpA